VPDFGDETSSTTEAEGPTLTQRIEEPAAMPKAVKIEEPRPEEKNIRNSKPLGRSGGTEDTKRSGSNPNEKKDG
jgi:hypothetical protein